MVLLQLLILKQRHTTQLSGVSCFGGHCVHVPRVLHWTIECCFVQWINFVLATFSVHPWNLSSSARISIGVLKLCVLYFVLTIKRLRAGFGIGWLEYFLWPAPHHPLPASSHKDNSLFLLIWLNGLFRPQWNCKFSVAVIFLQTSSHCPQATAQPSQFVIGEIVWIITRLRSGSYLIAAHINVRGIDFLGTIPLNWTLLRPLICIGNATLGLRSTPVLRSLIT